MSNEQKVVNVRLIGFLPALALIFIVMKLMGWGAVASWSWWWVTAPLWGGFALIFGILAAIFLFGVAVVGIASLIQYFSKR